MKEADAVPSAPFLVALLFSQQPFSWVQQQREEEQCSSHVRSEDLSGEVHKANWKSLNRQNQQMTAKSVQTSGRSKVTSSVVITMNLEFKYVPKEETIPIPLKYIDVAGSTHTHLDFTQEKRVADCWNVDSNRSCRNLGKVSRRLLY